MRVERPLREYEVSFVVDETGRVVANTIVVTPTPPDPPSARDGFARRQYFPARVDGCMVPSRTTATVILEG